MRVKLTEKDVLNPLGKVEGKNLTLNPLPYDFDNVSLVAIADMLVSQWIFGIDPSQAQQEAYDLAVRVLQDLPTESEISDVERGWNFVETWLASNHGRFDHDTYVRVVADADLFVYKKDGNKLLKKRVRESGLRDMGNYDKPAETIKWQLSKLVNTMENKPIIGS